MIRKKRYTYLDMLKDINEKGYKETIKRFNELYKNKRLRRNDKNGNKYSI
jgi:hypothetical protein